MSRSRSDGVSVLELLVALLVSVVVAFGVLQVFLNSRESVRTQRELATVRDAGRTAVDLLSRYVRMVAYRHDLNGLGLPESAVFAHSPVWVRRDAANRLMLSVRFQSDGRTEDCIGVIHPEYAIVVNVFAVRRGALVCAGTPEPQTDDWVALVDGIAHLHVDFGQDSDGDGAVNGYLDAAEANPDRAVSVRLRLTLSETARRTFAEDGGDAIETTVALRNRVAISLGEWR